jgi:hypothetical protein
LNDFRQFIRLLSSDLAYDVEQITKQRKNNLPFRPLGCSILEELRDILLDT